MGGGDLCIAKRIFQEIGCCRDMKESIDDAQCSMHLQVIKECIALLRPPKGYSIDALLIRSLRCFGGRHWLEYGRIYEIIIRRLGLKSHLYPYYYIKHGQGSNE